MDPRSNNSKPGFKQIEPASLNLSAQAAIADQSAKQRPGKSRWWLRVSLTVLLLVAAAVLFVLPDWAPHRELPGTPGATRAEPKSTTAPAKPVAESVTSPWSQAQLAKLRKQSQDILAQALERQEKLQQLGVERWAADEYQSAIALADQGDRAYRSRDFETAVSRYRNTLQALDKLIARVPEEYSTRLAAGKEALVAGNAAAAQAAFELALLLRPDSAEAQRGHQRALTLDAVSDLIAAGDDAFKSGDLNAAKSKFAEALALDPYADNAKTRLRQVKARILDKQFTAAMSEGYAHLDRDELTPARRAFSRALRTRPGAAEAESALQEVNDRITSVRIGELLAQAESLEQAERWTDAINKYDAALALDDNLVPAQQGKATARQRALLDQRLRDAIARPDRLSDKQVYADAYAVYRFARAIGKPGPRLKKQIAVLGSFLDESQQPVTVSLQSDNETNVTIYKVGNLGMFKEKQMSLLPGRYIVVGKRPGFRDVRVEFVVTPAEQLPPIVVACTEKIALGR